MWTKCVFEQQGLKTIQAFLFVAFVPRIHLSLFWLLYIVFLLRPRFFQGYTCRVTKGQWESSLGTSPELLEKMPSLVIKFTKLRECKFRSTHLPVVIILALWQRRPNDISPNKVKLNQGTERPDTLLALFNSGPSKL